MAARLYIYIITLVDSTQVEMKFHNKVEAMAWAGENGGRSVVRKINTTKKENTMKCSSSTCNNTITEELFIDGIYLVCEDCHNRSIYPPQEWVARGFMTQKEFDMLDTINNTGIDAAGLTIEEYNVPDSFIMTLKAEENCHKCSGTGTYVWGEIVNGVPSRSGKCFRCAGTGKNWALDKTKHAAMYNKLVSLKPRMTEWEITYVREQIVLLGGHDFAHLVITYLMTEVNPAPKQEEKKANKNERAPQLGTKGVRCGNHEKVTYHATAADVKACFGIK